MFLVCYNYNYYHRYICGLISLNYDFIFDYSLDYNLGYNLGFNYNYISGL